MSEQIKMQIAVMVTELLAKYKGGQVYFDNLDEHLRQEQYLESMLIQVSNLVHRDPYWIIASGKFGDALVQYAHTDRAKAMLKYDLQQFRIISLPGGLRKNQLLLPHNIRLYCGQHTNAIFVDDSYYAGLTYGAAKMFAEACNLKLNECFVLYDGSKEKQEDVHSFYRYYDFKHTTGDEK